MISVPTVTFFWYDFSEYQPFRVSLTLSPSGIHRRYPNLRVEDLERNYRKRPREEMEDDRIFHYNQDRLTEAISNMFTGEESWGRFIHLTMLHEVFLNLRREKTLTI